MQQTNVSATAYDDAYRTMCFLGADIVLVVAGALLVMKRTFDQERPFYGYEMHNKKLWTTQCVHDTL